MEGVPRYEVKLVPHNIYWKKEFKVIKNRIQNIIGDNIEEIQHVGSTSMDGICSKPILDIAVLVKEISAVDIKLFEEYGYEFCGNQSNNNHHILFVLRSENNLSLQHIHCFDNNDDDYYEMIKFRDIINGNRETALKYEMLKRELAIKYPKNRLAYTKGKAKFISKLITAK